MTGTGLGGSGGVPAGRVSEKVMDKLGHLPPFENPKRTAREVSNWFDKELSRYKQEAKVLRETKSLKSRNGEMMEVSDTWKEMVKLPSDVLRSSVREKL